MENNTLNFSHIPDSIRCKPLGKKKTCAFRLYNSYNPITKEMKMVSAIRIPYRDLIVDEEGNEYQLELVDKKQANGNPKYMDLWITEQMGGILLLHGKKISDSRIFQYLSMSNYNASNPNRDSSVRPIVELVDEVEGAKTRRSLKAKKREAEMMAEEMTDAEVRQYFASSGGNAHRPMETLREMLEHEAGENPDLFLKKGHTRETEINGNLKLASDADIIVFDKEDNSWIWPQGDVICPVKRGIGVSRYGTLLEHVTMSESGQRVYDRIKAELKAKD